MIRILLVTGLVTIASLAHANASPQQVLSNQQWREDLSQLAAAIKDIHFKPFMELSEVQFDEAVDRLNAQIPTKSDREIIIDMARIVALLRDGHTRLHLPRQYPRFALEAELGHSGTAPPRYDALKFHQMPVRFGLFSDGLFVTGATPERAGLIGQKVIRIGRMLAEQAIEATQAVSFYENQSRAKTMAPDRLALMEVLEALDVTDDSENVELVTRDSQGEITTAMLYPLSGSLDDWVDGQAEPPPRWNRYIDRDEWFELVPEDDAIYVQVNRFAENPKRPYSEFVADALSAARGAGVKRFVVDLRHNSGGIGAWTIPFTTGLTRSEFNQYGRLFVLIGGTTFSAAQHFLHEFEEFSYAIFVGQPSGARPSHFGDGKRVVLENSGLTLRVSTIYWHSWLANDFRDAIDPHLDAPLSSQDFFSGTDPAWRIAIEYRAPKGPAEQIAEQLRKGKIQNGLLLYQRYQTDATYAGLRSGIPDLMKVADELVDEGFTRPGMFIYFLLNQTFPGIEAVEAGLQRTQALAETN